MPEDKEKLKPLEGAVICLTGLSSSRKNELHSMVEKLGGRFTREFSTDSNTHLVATGKHGAKYEAARRTTSIFIVAPSWLEKCNELNARVSERNYCLPDSQFSAGPEPKRKAPSKKKKRLPFSAVRDQPLKFKHFYLFDVHDTTSRKIVVEVVRYYNGTLEWDLTNSVDVIVVQQWTPEIIRSLRLTARSHPKTPCIVNSRLLVKWWNSRPALLPDSAQCTDD